MKALVQRVSEARVTIDGEPIAEIGPGLVVLLCAVDGDGGEQADYLARKIVNLRIFDDADGKMNRALPDTGGAILAISQFTLAATWRKGNRPSFSGAGDPELARQLWTRFCDQAETLGAPVARGRFQSHMKVSLTNDGPVTIWMDTAER